MMRVRERGGEEEEKRKKEGRKEEGRTISKFISLVCVSVPTLKDIKRGKAKGRSREIVNLESR